jgi:hypothetical protein
MPLAVNAGEVATPLALVVAVLVPPAKVPLAPVWAGAVKVTVTPLAGDPFDVTVATSGLVNAVPTVALCPPPLVAVIAMVGGTPAVFVRLKLAGVVAPEVVAVTA